MSKYRAKLVADDTEEDLKLLAYNEKTKDLDTDITFYIDNKGEEESENVKDEKMSAAFVAAAHSLQSGEHGGKKRKAENNKNKRVPKFIKYNLCEDSILPGERSSLVCNDDSSSGGEVNNPSSDEE